MIVGFGILASIVLLCVHIDMIDQPPNKIAGAAAGWKSQLIEMSQVVLSRRSGSAQLWGR
jgi:hypothetical protein